jgi:CheY-like chemotaxis protein
VYDFGVECEFQEIAAKCFMSITILDVGQCGLDGPRLASLWRSELGAKVDRCDSARDALDRVSQNHYDLILVNRLLAADNSPGIEVLRQLNAVGNSIPVMLVSDLEDAQDAAVALGAVRGFGKAEMNERYILDLIRRTVGGEPTT